MNTVFAIIYRKKRNFVGSRQWRNTSLTLKSPLKLNVYTERNLEFITTKIQWPMAELTVVTILCLWKTYLRFQISDLRFVFHKFSRSQMRFWQTYWHKFFTNEKYYNFSSFSNFISTILISVNFIAYQLFQFQLLFWQSYYVCDNHIWFTIYYSSKLWYICYLEKKFYLFERLHKFFL